MSVHEFDPKKHGQPGKKDKKKGNGKDTFEASVKCYNTHKPLVLPNTAAGKIYGGSCIRPIVQDADIYVGLDGGMKFTKKQFPWNKGAEIYMKIVDGSVPESLEEFKKLLKYLDYQIKDGATVHIGCIGGHGRTGLVLAALVKLMLGQEDAIQYVRDHYCKRAVESQQQVDWLHKNFGIKKQKPTRKPIAAYTPSSSQGSFYTGASGAALEDYGYHQSSLFADGEIREYEMDPSPDRMVTAVVERGNIWGRHKT